MIVSLTGIMCPIRGKTWLTNILGVAWLAACGLGMWFFVGGLIKEWRSGAAFFRYRNWEGLWVSHADLLVVGAVTISVMIIGAAWSLWDRGSERRLAKRIAKDRRAG